MPDKHKPSLLDAPEGVACPWCGGSMKLRNVGGGGQLRRALVCTRHPTDHAIRIDAGRSAGAARTGNDD